MCILSRLFFLSTLIGCFQVSLILTGHFSYLEDERLALRVEVVEAMAEENEDKTKESGDGKSSAKEENGEEKSNVVQKSNVSEDVNIENVIVESGGNKKNDLEDKMETDVETKLKEDKPIPETKDIKLKDKPEEKVASSEHKGKDKEKTPEKNVFVKENGNIKDVVIKSVDKKVEDQVAIDSTKLIKTDESKTVTKSEGNKLAETTKILIAKSTDENKTDVINKESKIVKETVEEKVEDVATDKLKVEDVATDKLKVEDVATDKLKVDNVATDKLKVEDVATDKLKVEDVATDKLKVDNVATDKLKVDNVATDKLKVDKMDETASGNQLKEKGSKEIEEAMEVSTPKIDEILKDETKMNGSEVAPDENGKHDEDKSKQLVEAADSKPVEADKGFISCSWILDTLVHVDNSEHDKHLTLILSLLKHQTRNWVLTVTVLCYCSY